MSLFQKLKSEHSTYYRERNRIVRMASEALQLSKRSIFDLHRGDTKQAKKNLASAQEKLESLKTSFTKNPKLEFEGSYRAAVEEFVEATMFLRHLEKKPFTAIKGMNVFYEEYLGGLADMTGEIVRHTVKMVSSGHADVVRESVKTVEEVVAQMLEMNLTSKLRQKFDDAKRNLKRMEEILYDLEIRKK